MNQFGRADSSDKELTILSYILWSQGSLILVWIFSWLEITSAILFSIRSSPSIGNECYQNWKLGACLDPFMTQCLSEACAIEDFNLPSYMLLSCIFLLYLHLLCFYQPQKQKIESINYETGLSQNWTCWTKFEKPTFKTSRIPFLKRKKGITLFSEPQWRLYNGLGKVVV